MANTSPRRGSSEASDGDTGNLFESLNFYVSPSLRRDAADVIRRVLTKNGASLMNRERMQDVDYIITDSHTLERDELELDASSSAQQRIVTVSHSSHSELSPSVHENLPLPLLRNTHRLRGYGQRSGRPGCLFLSKLSCATHISEFCCAQSIPSF
jgi:hypothetical protein